MWFKIKFINGFVEDNSRHVSLPELLLILAMGYLQEVVEGFKILLVLISMAIFERSGALNLTDPTKC